MAFNNRFFGADRHIRHIRHIRRGGRGAQWSGDACVAHGGQVRGRCEVAGEQDAGFPARFTKYLPSREPLCFNGKCPWLHSCTSRRQEHAAPGSHGGNDRCRQTIGPLSLPASWDALRETWAWRRLHRRRLRAFASQYADRQHCPDDASEQQERADHQEPRVQIRVHEPDVIKCCAIKVVDEEQQQEQEGQRQGEVPGESEAKTDELGPRAARAPGPRARRGPHR